MKRLLPIIAAFSLLLCGCREDNYLQPFMDRDGLFLEQDGLVVFRYNEATCQTAFNRSRCQFRVFTDNMSDFYSITLSEIPSEEGQNVTGTLVWTSQEDTYTKRNVTFETLRIEGDRIWLWTGGRIGLVMQLFD